MPPSRPLVSALISAYNEEEFISAAIESVLCQDYPNIEVIVNDDGSTDSTRLIAESYSQVTVLHHENRGILRSVVEEGIPACNGEFIAMLGGDDLWVREKTSKQVAQFEKDPSLGLVYGDLTVVDRQLAVMYPSYWELGRIMPYRWKAAKQMIPLLNFISGSTAMFRAEYKEDLTPVSDGHEEWDDWWIAKKVAEKAEIDFLREPLTLYRYHGNNRSLVFS